MKTIQLDESLYVVVPRAELDAAVGDLAEHVATDCDHFGLRHDKWYRAVRRLRDLAATHLPEQPRGEFRRAIDAAIAAERGQTKDATGGGK